MQGIAHIHEIIGHPTLSQTEQPDIGSLCRPVASKVDGYHLLRAFKSLHGLLCLEVADGEHTKLIDFICRDIVLILSDGPSRGDWPSISTDLSDLSLTFIVTFSTGTNDFESPDDHTLHKDLWIRIAQHVTSHHEGTDSSKPSKFQASV